MKRLITVTAAVMTAAFLAAAPNASADENIDQVTYFTFSGAVQMPGVTLPAGKYMFRLADVASRNVVQVLDAKGEHVMGQWFFIGKIRTERALDKADGKPVVNFIEVPQGMAPPIKDYYYPTDISGKEFIYPKAQALKIAAASNQPVLATDSDVKGGKAHVFTVQPNGTEAEYNANADHDNNANNTASNTAAAAAPQQATVASSAVNNDQTVGTSGVDQNPAPSQQASNTLPTTASPFPMIALIGFLSLAGGFGLRLARNTN